MKKVTVIILIAAVLLTVGCLLTGCQNKGDVYLSAVEISATADEKGDLTVSETWNAVIDSSSPVRNIYKVLEFENAKQLDEFIDSYTVYDYETNATIEPSDAMYGIPSASGTYMRAYYDVSAYKVEIGVVFEPTERGAKKFTFRYKLPDAVISYNDCAVLYWSQFSSDFGMYIESYECRIDLPGENSVESDTDTLFWLHLDNSDTSDTYASGNTVVVSAEGISPNSEASVLTEVRIVTEKERFAATDIVREYDARDKIVDEETAWYESWLKETRRERVKYIVSLVLGILFALAAVALFVYYKFFFGKYDASKYPEYVREIPPGDTPAEMGYFFYHYDGTADSDKNRSRLISATIMDLTRRGLLELNPSGDDYTVHVNSVAEAEINDLKEHEKAVYIMLLKAERDIGKAFTMDEFSAYGKGHVGAVSADISAFRSSASREYRTGGYMGKYARNFSYPLGIFSIALAVVLWYFIADTIFLTIGMILFGLVNAFFAPKVPTLNSKGIAKHAEAHALKRFMLEFSNLKEYEIPQLQLWEEYMVYATMMGISERVLKELKAVYPELSDPKSFEPGGRFARSYLFTYFALSSLRGGMFDIGSHINNTVSAINNTVNAVKAGSGRSRGGFGGFGRGGGGFRGGGGGRFGGGGGFR